MMRAIMSAPPPAWDGTMTRIGFEGYSAAAPAVPAAPVIIIRAINKRFRSIIAASNSLA